MSIFKLRFFADKAAELVQLNQGLRFGFGLQLTVQPPDFQVKVILLCTSRVLYDGAERLILRNIFSKFILFPSSISGSSVDKPETAIALDITFDTIENATG